MGENVTNLETQLEAYKGNVANVQDDLKNKFESGDEENDGIIDLHRMYLRFDVAYAAVVDSNEERIIKLEEKIPIINLLERKCSAISLNLSKTPDSEYQASISGLLTPPPSLVKKPQR